MLDKQTILQQVTDLTAQGLIKKPELDAAYLAGAEKAKIDTTLASPLKLGQILYFIGGGIIFLGIAVLLGENWQTLSFVTKLLASLGTAIAAYSIGLLLSSKPRTTAVGSAFYLLSALTAPIGIYVVMQQDGLDLSIFATQTLLASIVFSIYFLSYLWQRKQIFLLFSILFGTWLYFSATNWQLQGQQYGLSPSEQYEYQLLIAGIAYLLLGVWFSKDSRAALKGFLYGFGVLGVLGAALGLATSTLTWEFIYPLLVASLLLISVRLKSTSILTFTTLFLMLYILQVTAQHFSNNLGWPLALVLAGLAIVGIGLVSLNIKRLYWRSGTKNESPPAPRSR